MQWTARLLAVVLLLHPIHADAQYTTRHDPGFMLLAVPEDPQTYAAGAGPAGGFGVAAAADNPAALAFGYRWQIVLPVRRDEDGGAWTASVRYLGASGWSTGISTTLIDSKRVREGEYQLLTRFIAAHGWDSAYALGASISYVRSSHRDLYDSYRGEYTQRRSLAEAVAVGLGLRLHGPWILDPPAIQRRGRSIVVGNYPRPRWSLGLAINDITIATALDTDYWLDARPHARLTLGGTLRPVHNPWMGVMLNASATHWFHDTPEGRTAVGARQLSFSRWRVGLGLDVCGMMETGIALGGGYRDAGRRGSAYIIIGPPFFRLMAQGYFLQDRFLYQDNDWRLYYEPRLKEELARISLSISWPFRYYRNEPEPEFPSIY